MNHNHTTPGTYGVAGRPPTSNEEDAMQNALAVITFVMQDEFWPAFWKWCEDQDMYQKGPIDDDEEDFDLEEGLRENLHIGAHVIAEMIQRYRQIEIGSRNQLN